MLVRRRSPRSCGMLQDDGWYVTVCCGLDLLVRQSQRWIRGQQLRRPPERFEILDDDFGIVNHSSIVEHEDGNLAEGIEFWRRGVRIPRHLGLQFERDALLDKRN